MVRDSQVYWSVKALRPLFPSAMVFRVVGPPSFCAVVTQDPIVSRASTTGYVELAFVSLSLSLSLSLSFSCSRAIQVRTYVHFHDHTGPFLVTGVALREQKCGPQGRTRWFERVVVAEAGARSSLSLSLFL